MMKKLLAIKQTEGQRDSNQTTRFQFIMAMLSLDEKHIFQLLKPNSLFLGNKNNWQFTHWLSQQFSTYKGSGFHSNFKEGISLDYYPGSETIEFEFALMINNDFMCEDPFDEKNQKNRAINGYKKIRLVLSFEDGKISDIRIPKFFFKNDNINRLKAEN